MTPEEIKALEKAKIAAAAKEKEGLTSSQLQQQIDELKKLVELTKSKDASNDAAQKAINDAAAADKLKKEADIKKMLTSSNDSKTNFDDLSNEEMLDIIATAVDTAIDAKTQIATSEVGDSLKGITDTINGIQKYLLQNEAASGVKDARNRFSDFDDYKDEITAIIDKYPGMAIDDAYVLAKGNKAAGSPGQKDVESEKPMNLGTRAAAAQDAHDKKRSENNKSSDDNDRPNTRRGFKAALSAAADKVLQSRKQ